MTLKYPCVTAIVNTYNRCGLLPRALDSVLVQAETFNDLEVLVVDDASTDNTATVIKEYATKFDAVAIPFIPIGIAENSGAQAVPKNQGIIFARGDFIRFLDDDNEWTPGSLKVLVDAAQEGDVWPDIVYGRRTYVADPGFIQPKNPVFIGDSSFVEHDPDRLAASPTFNYIDTSDALIARGAFWWTYHHTNMFWNEDWRRFGDWELFTRMANLDKLVGAVPPRFKGIDAVVSIYHWHDVDGGNLQIRRALHESPVAKSLTTGEVI